MYYQTFFMHNAIFSMLIWFKLLTQGSLLGLNSKRIPFFCENMILLLKSFILLEMCSLIKVWALSTHISEFEMLRWCYKTGIFQCAGRQGLVKILVTQL